MQEFAHTLFIRFFTRFMELHILYAWFCFTTLSLIFSPTEMDANMLLINWFACE